MASNDVKFDLTGISDVVYVKWLRFKWATFAFVTVVSTLAAASLALFAIEESLAGRFYGKGVADLGLVAFFGIFAFLFLLVGNARVRHPATSVEIRQEGVKVKYPSGSEVSLDWSNPSFRLKIGNMYSPSLKQSVRTSFFLWKPRLFMPDEAAEAIIGAARGHGLSVQVVRDPSSATGDSILIHGRDVGPTVSSP